MARPSGRALCRTGLLACCGMAPRKDLQGQQFGRLTVIALAPARRTSSGAAVVRWACRCACGTQTVVDARPLLTGNTSSCGCLYREQRPDLVGRTFGRLTVVAKAPSRGKGGYWQCSCECGAELAVRTSELLAGRQQQSCGCLYREQLSARNRTHGQSDTATWEIWVGMRARCRDVGNKHYGGRGIRVDPRWESFEVFLADMGERPPGMQIDRIDNDGPYAPGNCRWATCKENQNNRRTNRAITFDDRTQTVSQWADEIGLSRGVLDQRFAAGWSVERALTTPLLSVAAGEVAALANEARWGPSGR
jgi:hypothetical protein